MNASTVSVATDRREPSLAGANRRGFQTLAQVAAEIKAHAERAELLAKLDPTPRGAGQKFKPAYSGPCREDCPICLGNGFVRFDVTETDPRFGRLDPCPNMPVEKRHFEWRNGLYLDEEEQLSWDYVKDWPLERLAVNGQAVRPATALRARDGVRRYVEQGYGMIYLYGSYGIAKSLLIKIAVAEALRSGSPAAYARMSEILDNLRMAFDEKDSNQAAMRRMGHWASVPVLAIDELEKINPTEWVAERLFQLFDRRYNDALRRQSLTLIASNKRPEEIGGDLAYAIASRVHDGRCLYVEMTGSDARPAMTEVDLF